ncbi:hypothetical protein [Marilutibacter alkalisoli]|uniref:Transmembrane repetitive protein n=1 Tax=Marilutibacter alkalisoli TaxID=2591633 RepID=A0A514BRT4_9GAMM|nr:hypothetical protein [Lysobacter alkalisoli]QDH70108.1 hypothetical protein FKV23_08375 [Lysobacter alkalisoli]
MFSAADLIQAVQRRLRLTQWRLNPPGQFPPGWDEWLARMRELPGAVTGATAEAMLAVLLARPAVRLPSQPMAELTRWQAFTSIWRQQWHPPSPDQRGLRWLAGSLSAVIHILLGVLLLWLLFAPPRYGYAPPEGEMVVQIEYIGEGTPDEVGGGPAVEPEAEPEASPMDSGAPAEPLRPVVDTPQPQPDEVQPPAIERAEVPLPAAAAPLEVASTVTPPDIPMPELSEPEIEQPLTVSEPAPDTTGEFFLPPPTPTVAEPVLAAPELEASTAAIPNRDVPTPMQAPSRPALDIQVQATPAAPEVSARMPEVATREISAPVRRPELPAISAPSVQTPELQARTTLARERSVPTPTRAAASATEAGTAPESVAGAETAAAGERAEPAASAAAQAAPGTAGAPSTTSTGPATRPGSGPRLEPAPGGWPSPARSDDWGASTRNVPGGQRGEEQGIYDSEGRVRLGEPPGSAAPGQPPGTYTEEIADLDRSGTWLKRPPIGYEPTLFDRYWRPNESLLEEWVRRGVREMEVSVPGTSKKIRCVVSLLQLGGGCGISDPNLNEQPAEARPPPDIPFKPELQEDNGSVRPDEQAEAGA